MGHKPPSESERRSSRSARSRTSRWLLLFGQGSWHQPTQRAKRVVLVIGVLLAIFAAAWYPALVDRDVQSTDDAYVRADVTPVASRVEGYLVAVPVNDNQHVHRGDVLARVQDTNYLARVAEAQANLEHSEAALANALSRTRLQQTQVVAAAAAMVATQADLDRAVIDRARYHDMLPSGSASRQQVDLADADAKRLKATLARERAEWIAAQQQVQVGETDVDEARANIHAMRAVLDERKIELGWTRITAPVDGVVGERNVRVGVYVRPGTQIVDVVPLPHVWVVANFRESQLAHIRPKQHVSIRVDGVPGVAFTGVVDSLQPASGAQFALLPPDNATGNFTKVVQRFPVKIVLDRDQGSVASLLPGVSVVATVDTPCPSVGTRCSATLVGSLFNWLRGRQ
ncbi:membrane fusion protein (multidrug efflux system) [Rhodanobacter sp. TND4EL1]